MPHYLDTVPSSGISRIRDMLYSVKGALRLDQGDLSFDAPDSLKTAMHRAIDENRTHYLQTTGVPRLLELLADKLRERNGIPVESPDQVMATNGGVHGLCVLCQALLEPGDEVLVPDPEWPSALNSVLTARGVGVRYPLDESRDWRPDIDEMARLVTSRTRAIYINSPNNPTGGVLTRDDLQRIAALAIERDLWVISDEAYESVVFDGAEHVSIGSLPGMYDRTISVYSFSKTYAITGVRLGYLAVKSGQIRERLTKLLFLTASNVSSIAQYGGIGGLEGSYEVVEQFRRELQARRDLFYAGIQEVAGRVFSGRPPRGAFYAFLRINPAWRPADARVRSISWAMTEHLIERAHVGCVPGVDFGQVGEGYIRFCFGRDRAELTSALHSMQALFSATRSV